MDDRRCRESKGKAKIKWYMSISDEEAHQCCRFGICPMDHVVLFPILVPFQLPDTPCCRPTSHKPLCHVVRTLPPVPPHMNLVLVFVYHLYSNLLYLHTPKKKEVFPPEFRLSVFHLIILPHSALYLCSTLYFQLASHSQTIPHFHFTLSHTP